MGSCTIQIAHLFIKIVINNVEEDGQKILPMVVVDMILLSLYSIIFSFVVF